MFIDYSLHVHEETLTVFAAMQQQNKRPRGASAEDDLCREPSRPPLHHTASLSVESEQPEVWQRGGVRFLLSQLSSG